jgi:cobalt-zinc-cadmium efflux system outer membrane protein
LEPFFTLTWEQPVEIGHRTGYREAIARAGFTQTQWNIVQAELLALVETYRAHQTATYRREKWLSALRLSRFHAALVETLRRQREANQVGPADVILAEVESQSIDQEVEAARQEYEIALAELRRRIGIAECASSIEPAGDLQAPEPPPAESEQSLISMAMASRPEIQAAKAQLASSRAALSLARADRIPIPSLGPAYEKSETGESFYGIALTSPVPLLNAGKTLVLQREAEYHRDAVVVDQWCQRVQTEVRSSLVRWEQARQSLVRSRDWARSIDAEAVKMRNLYDAGQADLVKLLEVQRRHLGAESARLDALWRATQAYADLLAALGAVSLLGSQEAPEEVPLPQ